MSADIRKALGRIHLFSGMSQEFLNRVAEFTTVRRIRAGETIFCQGEPSPYCFGVLLGEVSIARVSGDSRFGSKLIGVLGPGELFGESSFFQEGVRAAMASATQPGELLVISGAQLRQAIQSDAQAGMPLVLGMLQNCIERLRNTSLELSTIYGVGRLLGTAEPFELRLDSALSFLKSSVPDVDCLALYRRSPYWEEFERFFPRVTEGEAPGPLSNAFLDKARNAEAAIPIDLSKDGSSVQELGPEWNRTRSAIIVPIRDLDDASRNLQAVLMVGSREGPSVFSSETFLVFNAVAMPLSESLSRQRREQDESDERRLKQTRGSISF